VTVKKRFIFPRKKVEGKKKKKGFSQTGVRFHLTKNGLSWTEDKAAHWC
jgi:hypothetical protein